MWRHSTSFISGDEEGHSSSEEDVLVDDEKELPRSCGFTDKFKVRNSDLIYLFIWIQEVLVGGVAVGRELTRGARTGQGAVMINVPRGNGSGQAQASSTGSGISWLEPVHPVVGTIGNEGLY